MIRRTIPTDEGGKYWYDAEAAEAGYQFFVQRLTLTVAEWSGRPFIPSREQEQIIRDVFGWKRTDDNTRRYRTCFIWVPRKWGKRLDINTYIPTLCGGKTMGELVVGDVLFNESGAPTSVIATHPIEPKANCYRVSFSDGTHIVADAEHLWTVEHRNSSRKTLVNTFETQELAQRGIISDPKKNERRFRLPKVGALQFPARDLLVDPYLLGIWLGDGRTDDSDLTLNDRDRAEIMDKIGAQYQSVTVDTKHNGAAARVRYYGGMKGDLRALGVLGCKYVPVEYLTASVEQRLALLAGLVDYDGHVERSKIEIITTVPRLRDDIARLIRELGFKATVNEKRATLYGKDCGPCWRIVFAAYTGEGICYTSHRVGRLKHKPQRNTRARTVQITSVEPVSPRPARCITVDTPSGLFRAGIGAHPTHNSEWAAGMGLLLLVGDNEPAAEIYCIATTEDQARIIYDRATAMVLNDNEGRGGDGPFLADAITPFKTNIWYHDTGSKMQVLTGKPVGKHGLVTSGVLADEVHEWPNDELYNFVHQAEGNRRQPLDLFTSTAGKKAGPGWDYYKLCEAILDGSVIAPDTYVFIASADPERNRTDTEYWTTEEAWAEANPNYPITPKKSYLEAECNKAKGSPRLENNFKKYHLNLWVEQDTRWLNMTRWDACEHSDWRTMGERMRGRPCVAGVDLSAVSDLTCRSLVFPPQPGDPWHEVIASDGSITRVKRWHILPRFFIPRGRMDERVKLDKQPFDKWVRAKAVDATPGDVINQTAVHDLLLEDAELYDLQAVMIDRWNATQFAINLRDEGLDAQMFGQGYGSMSGPSKWLERAILLQMIDHGGHPVLRWCASNVAITEDAAENIKPSKEVSTDRIDGIVATIMGIGGCDTLLTEGDDWEMVDA